MSVLRALFGAGTWGTGGNLVAWVLCGALAFGWLRAKLKAQHLAQLAQAARHHKETLEQAAAHHAAALAQGARHHAQALDAASARHEAQLDLAAAQHKILMAQAARQHEELKAHVTAVTAVAQTVMTPPAPGEPVPVADALASLVQAGAVQGTAGERMTRSAVRRKAATAAAPKGKM